MKTSVFYRFLCVFVIVASVLWGAVTSAKAAGTTYYVATNGNDSNPGTSAQPFLTIGKAASLVNPGDTVIIRSGIYNVSGDPAIAITRSGSSTGGYIVFKSEVAHGAKIVGTSGYDVIKINANYIEIQGLDVSGATSQDGHCIESENSHHTRIIGNRLHDCGGSGFQGNYGDYYYVEGNVTYNNANRNTWATSGISIYQARAISDNAAGFHNIIRNNISFNNIEISSGTHTDGNGIIFDDSQNTQNSSTAGRYPYSTLIENNLAYYNGGKGIQVFLSEHVLVRNNTAYKNNRDNVDVNNTWRGELNISFSSDVQMINNIGWTDSSFNSLNTAFFEGADGWVPEIPNVWKNNLGFDSMGGRTVAANQQGEGTAAALAKENDMRSSALGNKVGVNPLFIATGFTETANFRLQASSPAINAGTSAYGLPTLDLDGNARVSGAAVDMGAYEYGGAAPTATNIPGGPTNTPVATSTSVPPTSTPTNTPAGSTLTIQAEAFSSKHASVTVYGTSDPLGGVSELGSMDNGRWAAYNNVNFGNGVLSVRVRGATDQTSGQLQLRTGSATGPIFCTINMSSTGGWSTYGYLSANCASSPTGMQNLYITVSNFNGFNLNWIELQFSAASTPTNTPVPPTSTPTNTPVPPTSTPTSTGGTTLTIQAESYTSKAAGVTVYGTGDPLGGVDEIGGMDNGRWVAYNNVNFGAGILSVRVRGATAVTSGQLQFRTGSATGPIFCTINMSSTGGWSTYGYLSANCASSPTGTQNLYITVSNFNGFNLNWIELNK